MGASGEHSRQCVIGYYLVPDKHGVDEFRAARERRGGLHEECGYDGRFKEAREDVGESMLAW